MAPVGIGILTRLKNLYTKTQGTSRGTGRVANRGDL